MTAFSIIVIGASAGGVGALRALTAGLTKPLPVPILVVLHMGAQRSQLPDLLNTCGPTPASHGEDGVLVKPGHIYIAPPDRHMIVVDDRLRLTRGPKENWARPAIDPLFRSAAESYGAGVIGVILSGNLGDGTAGLYDIKRCGGIAIAQSPSDAAYPEMPTSAASHVDLDYCLPLSDIPELLTKLVTEESRAVANPSPSTLPRNGHDTIRGGGPSSAPSPSPAPTVAAPFADPRLGPWSSTGATSGIATRRTPWPPRSSTTWKR